jgi:hypothetical protein
MMERGSSKIHHNQHQKNRAAMFVIRLKTEITENKTLSLDPLKEIYQRSG